MNKIILFIFLFAIVSTNSNTGYSQVNRKFTADSLISELRSYYTLQEVGTETNNATSEKDSVISILENNWNSSISSEEKNSIIKITNYQISRRFNKNTTIWDFFRTVTYLKQNNQTNFTPWLSMLEYMSGSSLFTSEKVKNFITNTYLLSHQNYLSKTSSVRWKIKDNTNYKFEFDEKNKTFNISVPTTQLEAYSIDNDTIRIFNTKGNYNMLESKWTGKYGKITWEKYDIPSSTMNVKLKNYKINMKKTEFTADSVTYTNKNILKNEILGKVKHIVSLRAYKDGLFPQFRSYRNDYKIKSKQENIVFTSGIEMRGKTLRYVGTDAVPAIAEYIKAGNKYLKCRSESFSSLEKYLKSNQAYITLYIADNDSITHPNVSLTVKEDEFSFIRNHDGTGKRPFYNSYQKTYITVDNIVWNMKDSLIRFYSRLGNDGQFKSFDYFTKADFTKHRMYETTNPLFDIKKYTRKLGSREFFAQDYAAFIRKPQTATIHRLMGLWYEGFIDYNPKTKYVIVRQKLYDYIKYFFEKKDYDVINITAKGKTRKGETELFPLTNAVYDIKTNQMALFGVEQVILNERKKVGLIPHRQMLILGYNRNLIFSGRLRVGLADFYGNGFSFNYKNYDISFTEIDSLIYRVWDEELTENGKKMKAKFLNSTIENVSGKIRIDVSSNKSGAKKIEQFPKFICSDTSYVYYDKRNKQGNVYSRDKFYFKNFPFTHDSLLYLTKDNLTIPGRLIAGGILPNFEDTLSVQKDYSLGFIHQTPDGGFPLFSGKGTLSSLNNEMNSYIKLSNSGLEANGVAKWNNTTIATKDFTLYPDSLTTLADEIEISEFVNQETYAEFPVVKGKLVQTTWDALSDVVRYKTTGIAAEMYDEKVKFSGSFEYRPKELTGSGRAKVDEGTIYAEDFTFNKKSFLSDKADVIIKEDNSEEKDVIIKNMKSFVDINSGKAVFQEREDEESYVNFVNDEYMSYPNHLVWHTGKGKINMNYNMNKFTNPLFSKEEILLDSAYLIDYCRFDKALFSSTYGDLKFISTNINQDSLMFFGSRANYYTGNKKIITKDVQKIIVADIVVTPSSNVVIDENGEMEKLLKTTVKARGVHNISEVDIKINSSKKYVASSGIYQYEDMNRKLQNINFDNITYDVKKEASVAHGFIEQYEKFTLNPWFDYYGDVYFNASKDRLNFEGFAKLIHTCPSVPQWFYFKSEINPDSIYLPLEPRLHSDIASNKARVYADVMSSKDSIHTFPVFLSADPYGNSESILSLRDSSFYVAYNQNENMYQITTLNKFNDRTLPDKYLDLKRSTCIVHGDGDIILSKSIKINDFGSVGELRFDTNADEVTMGTLTYMDFFFSKKALDILTEKLKLNISLSAVQVQNNTYKKTMSQLLGVEETEKMLSEMSINDGKPKKFPDKLKKTIVFTNLAFKWDAESKSFKSIGKIGISNIGNQMINKYVNGYIQIRKRRTGDKIFIYLETSEKEWFFFTFSGGIMRTLSSVSEYNQTIADLKTKYKKQKTEKGIFNYMLTNTETKNLFIYAFTGVHPAIDDFEDEGENNNDENNEDNY
ncbi:MAG: hypothetical protein L3J35_05290 [Bacteroidales bacterium]|nr:hypothetical protein [Bacteroidales bacterium]